MKWLISGVLICLNCMVLFAQSGNAGCRVELYLLKTNFSPTADIDEPIEYFMPVKADLAEKPLVADNEITGYDIQGDSAKPYYFNFSKPAAVRVDSIAKRIPLYGLRFAVVVNGEPVFGGIFLVACFILCLLVAYCLCGGRPNRHLPGLQWPGLYRPKTKQYFDGLPEGDKALKDILKAGFNHLHYALNNTGLLSCKKIKACWL